MDFEECIVEDSSNFTSDERGFDGAPIIVKTDTAGSLTSIQDTVDEMPGVYTVHMGLGSITTRDIERAGSDSCKIFGFNVRLHNRERKLAESLRVEVILRSTIHELIEEINLHASNQK